MTRNSKQLNEMVSDDEVFKYEFDQETPLRAAFVDREIWYFDGGDPFPYEWDEEQVVIEQALLNRGEFACQQKDRFRKNMDNTSATTEEKERILEEIDSDLYHIMNHLDAFRGICEDTVEDMYEKVIDKYIEDIGFGHNTAG